MSDMAVDYQRRPISVDELELMFASGVLDPDEDLELIEGELFVKPPDTRRHRSTVNRLNRLFTASFNFRAVVQINDSVVLEPYSAPKPDLALLLEDPTCYEGRDPGPGDMLLAIEVGDTSRVFDLTRKLPLYARYGVREVWLVDVVERTIGVHREPRDRWYGRSQLVTVGEIIACDAFPDDEIAVDDILLPDSIDGA